MKNKILEIYRLFSVAYVINTKLAHRLQYSRYSRTKRETEMVPNVNIGSRHKMKRPNSAPLNTRKRETNDFS